MRTESGCDGSTTVMVLGVLLFISIFSLGTYIMVQKSIQEVTKRSREEDIHQSLVSTAERVLDALIEDATPFADSPIDQVWNDIDRLASDTLSVSLRDISSYYGINWIRKDVLSHSGLIRIGKSADELQQYRWDTGMHAHLVPDYVDYIEEQNLEIYFTVYNYFNINICDEFALERLICTRTGDEIAAFEIRTKVQEFWRERQPDKPEMIEADELTDILGSNYTELYPVVNVEPVLNIHFVPENILLQLLSFEYHDIPRSRVQFIIDSRKNSEWSTDDLNTVIGQNYQKTFLHHYLGVITWFWELHVIIIEDDKSSAALKWIIARVPHENGSPYNVSFRLIEEEISLD
jgi:hypothetical protein